MPTHQSPLFKDTLHEEQRKETVHVQQLDREVGRSPTSLYIRIFLP